MLPRPAAVKRKKSAKILAEVEWNSGSAPLHKMQGRAKVLFGLTKI